MNLSKLASYLGISIVPLKMIPLIFETPIVVLTIQKLKPMDNVHRILKTQI